jgi:tetratricopeptide (TPR) repeat protein
MNLKPIFVLIIIVSLILQLRNCEYGAEHQVKFDKFDPKYENAHLTAVSAQNLLGEKEYAEALRYYEMARTEMEHPNIRADKGEDIYINYGFVMNDIGVIHLSWALYGEEMDTDISHIDPKEVDMAELGKAKDALETAIDFYLRWYGHNKDDYELFAKAISESYTNLGTTLKYSGEQEKALEAFRLALLHNPDSHNAKRAFEILDISPTPYVEAGKEELKKHKKLPI